MALPKALLAPVLVLLSLALPACGDDDGDGTATAPEPAATAPAEAPPPSGALERSPKVEIVEFAYEPDPVQVQAGGKVIWHNMDSAPHTATADDGSFDTGTLEEGKLKSESFKEAGTHTYFCEIHPEMRGTVEVVDGY